MSSRISARTTRVRRVLDALGFTAPTGQNWREQAACQGTDPEVFYPVGAATQLTVRTLRAKQVCADCPVRQSCLADVMATEDPGLRWGVCGGLSASERSVLFAGRRAEQSREVA
jgi:WhiB family redox-sensing transcriptional regulator